MFKYVIDRSDSSRHYRAVYRTIKEIGENTICRHVGDIVNGRVQWVRVAGDAYRLTKNLEPYEV
jgi:hypothetical protein